VKHAGYAHIAIIRNKERDSVMAVQQNADPSLGFGGPVYFRHERIRRSMASFDIVRSAPESAMPRRTMK
jgi:hypothetical protein